MNIDLKSTLAKISERCKAAGVNCLVTRDPASALYLTGVTAHSAGDMVVLIRPSDVIIFTDNRYTGTVERVTAKHKRLRTIIWDRKNPGDEILKHVPKGAVLGFEKNSDLIPQHFALALQKAGRKRGIRVKGVPDILVVVRSIKSPAEIAIMRKAFAFSDEAFLSTVGYIKPGVTEQEIAQRLNAHLRRLSGADELSFSTIVASGQNGAVPHARVTGRKIRKGDMVTVDFGCVVNGYHTDTTRTVFVGKPSPEKLRIYNIVLAAQTAAEKQARPGMTGREIDGIARDIIREAGYGEWFTHSTGHGVGLDEHEKPHVTPAALGKNVVKEGMVFSIEPGIYLPGKYGVRIENTGVMSITGFLPLSSLPKGPLVL